jgi:NDP-sugar pyrophosphorylase family protein
MHAVILAGGKGVRLRPYTTALPKPLVPIGDSHAILDIVLEQLASCGFRSVTLAINHLGRLIRAFVGDGGRWGLAVEYVEETLPLSTVGPLFGLKDRLPEQFLVMNGDVLTDLDYGDLLHAHAMSGAPLTVAVAERETKIEFGVLTVEGDKVVGFTEKPAMTYRVSMGVYGMSRRTLSPYPEGLTFGFDQLVLDLLGTGDHPACYGFGGYWLDIGRPEDYDAANRDFERLRPLLLPARASEVAA